MLQHALPRMATQFAAFVLLFTTILWTSGGLGNAQAKGIVLTDTEMTYIFGDTIVDPPTSQQCKGEFYCKDNFTVGSDKCGRCEGNGNFRTVCCTKTLSGIYGCTYDSDNKNNNCTQSSSDFLVGYRSGNPDECGGCSIAGTPTKDGTCAAGFNRASATSIACPQPPKK